MKSLALLLLIFTPLFAQVAEKTLPFPSTSTEADEVLSLPFEPEVLSLDERAEKEMLAFVNEERRKLGLKELVVDLELVQVARLHSFDMWERQYFAHKNPDGETPFDRMIEENIDFDKAGENLALARSTERAHRGLMNSAGHKRNILDPKFGRIGIGAVDGGPYGKMFTQEFAD